MVFRSGGSRWRGRAPTLFKSVRTTTVNRHGGCWAEPLIFTSVQTTSPGLIQWPHAQRALYESVRYSWCHNCPSWVWLPVKKSIECRFLWRQGSLLLKMDTSSSSTRSLGPAQRKIIRSHSVKRRSKVIPVSDRVSYLHLWESILFCLCIWKVWHTILIYLMTSLTVVARSDRARTRGHRDTRFGSIPPLPNYVIVRQDLPKSILFSLL